MQLKRLIPLAAAAACSGAAFAQTPGFYLLGLPPGHTQGAVRGLSADGTVATGNTHSGSALWQGFTWTAAGGRIDFGLEPGMPTATPAGGISSDGTVVAGAMGSQSHVNTFRAYRRVGNGPLEDLGLLPGYQRSFGVTTSGDGNTVIGISEIGEPGLVSQAFRWTPSGGMQGLGYLRPFSIRSEAEAISRDGSTIVGTSVSGALEFEAFRWTQSGGMQELAMPAPFIETHARAVNADGSVIVGGASPPFGQSESPAVRWSGVGFEALPLMPGFHRALALAVDDSGDLVGGTTSGIGQRSAFVWTSAMGTMLFQDYLDLHGIIVPAGWNIENIYAISGDGMTFAGEARSPTGMRQGFVATIPSPSFLGLVLASGLLVGRRCRAAS